MTSTLVEQNCCLVLLVHDLYRQFYILFVPPSCCPKLDVNVDIKRNLRHGFLMLALRAFWTNALHIFCASVCLALRPSRPLETACTCTINRSVVSSLQVWQISSMSTSCVTISRCLAPLSSVYLPLRLLAT